MPERFSKSFYQFIFSPSWWLRWWRFCLQCRRPGFNLWVGEVHWRRVWQPTPVFLPGEFHRQRRLTGYRPRGDMTDSLTHILSQAMICRNSLFNLYVLEIYIMLLSSWSVMSNSEQTPWTAACQASLFFTISQSLHKLLSIE